ncbi:MAG TPA: LPXTG cell wall anchor domain-containing protein [Sphingomonas sp.]|nr:LPXTG cell wall anchor domain-containing protein [Sphingomonas sp.]
MTTDRGAIAALLATLTVMSATPAAAQSQETPQTAPVRVLEGLATPQATQIPVPDAPKIVLPATTQTPRAPRPRTTTGATPASRTTAKPASEPATTGTARQPTARARPTTDTDAAADPRSAPTTIEPTPVTTPATEPAPAPPVPSPVTESPQSVVPDATATSTAGTTPESTLTAPETGRAMPLWLSIAAIVVVLGGLWFLRRRKPASRYDRAEPDTVAATLPPEFAEPDVAEPAAPDPAVSDPNASTPVPRPGAAAAIPPVARTTVPAIPAATAPQFLEPRAKSPPAVPRARLACELRPLRAGLNLLSATVECELVVTNTGNAAAESIRAGVSLLTAHAGQDTDLAAFNAAPVARPVAASFALAAGETRTLRTVVAVAREAIRTMTAANRPMFVPVVAANLRYVTAGDDAQTARAWSIGIERVDSAKLAPFWLDAPARMYTTVAARPHAAEFDS